MVINQEQVNSNRFILEVQSLLPKESIVPIPNHDSMTFNRPHIYIYMFCTLFKGSYSSLRRLTVSSVLHHHPCPHAECTPSASAPRLRARDPAELIVGSVDPRRLEVVAVQRLPRRADTASVGLMAMGVGSKFGTSVASKNRWCEAVNEQKS